MLFIPNYHRDTISQMRFQFSSQCFHPLVSYCSPPLHEECPKHYEQNGDLEVTLENCVTIGEKAQMILVWVKAPRIWECLLPTEIKNHEDKTMRYA